jgi:CheY-like chemotaxis protein
VSRHKILVVEDDVEIRDALMDVLEQNGCEPVGVANGERALAYLRSTTSLPCLILLDLMMPVMDGRSFREVQLQDPVLSRIPVVVISAHRDLQESIQELKVASFIKKPPRMEDLVSAVARHCQA